MTIAGGIQVGSRVYLVADTACMTGDMQTKMIDKIYRVDYVWDGKPALIVGAGELAAVCKFVEGVRSADTDLDSWALRAIADDIFDGDTVAEFLVAHPEGLLHIGSDGSMLPIPEEDPIFIGNGAPYAYGALSILRETNYYTFRTTERAVLSACGLAFGCGEPITSYEYDIGTGACQ